MARSIAADRASIGADGRTIGVVEPSIAGVRRSIGVDQRTIGVIERTIGVAQRSIGVDQPSIGVATKTLHSVNLPSGSAGKTLWVLAQWINERGENGPTSVVTSAMIAA